MYPCEPFSAAAFMNSASSCFKVSAVAFGDAETAGRVRGTAMIAAKHTTARTGRKGFIEPPCARILLHETVEPQGSQRNAEETRVSPVSSVVKNLFSCHNSNGAGSRRVTYFSCGLGSIGAAGFNSPGSGLRSNGIRFESDVGAGAAVRAFPGYRWTREIAGLGKGIATVCSTFFARNRIASQATQAIIPHQPNVRTTAAICVSWSSTPRLEKIVLKSCLANSGSPVVTSG